MIKRLRKHDFIEETRPVRPAKRDDDDETKKAEKDSQTSEDMQKEWEENRPKKDVHLPL